MEKQNLFKWKHYQPDIILLTARWYLRYNLSFRDLVEMMEERGLSIAHTTIMRWVHQYGPELDERVRRHLKTTNDSWRVDETYVKAKGKWMYLYHRFIKKRVRSMLGLKSFSTATSILSGIEAIHMIKKGQLISQDKSVQNQVEFIHELFKIAD